MNPSTLPTAGTRLRDIALPLAVALYLVCASAAAQSRWVFVNGQRMSDAQVAALSRASCSDIPDGAYWLNTRTGAWGYAGTPQVQGVLGDRCGNGTDPDGAMNRDGTVGPFATMRRAQEVADSYRQRGFSAVAFHNGDGYYVRVAR